MATAKGESVDVQCKPVMRKKFPDFYKATVKEVYPANSRGKYEVKYTFDQTSEIMTKAAFSSRLR